MRDVACTVNVVEQAHGSAAVLSRDHPYGEECLMHRAALHKLRAWFAPGDEGKLLDKLRGKLLKLNSRRPDRVTGRHMCMQDLAKEAQRNLRGRREELVPAVRDGMVRHADYPSSLDDAQKMILEERARRYDGGLCLELGRGG